MLWRVLVPLAVTWLIGSAVAIGVATAFTSRAFDRALLDDAYAIAATSCRATALRCSACRRRS